MSPIPLNKTLYARVKQEAKRRFKIWPSAYASGWLVNEYKRRGGKYKGDKTKNGIGRWFKEKWLDTCALPKRVACGRSQRGRAFPYCRPSVRVNRGTPKTVQEFSVKQLNRLCSKKRKNPAKRMKSQRRSLRRSRSRSCVRVSKSKNRRKKFKVIIPGKNCSIHFGGAGYSDYTKHKDPKRKTRYIKRHAKRENWSKNGMCSAGFWSKHLLWNKPSVEASKRDIKKRFKVVFCS